MAVKSKAKVKSSLPTKGKAKAKGDIYSKLRDEAKGGRGNRRDYWKPTAPGKAVIRLVPFVDAEGEEHLSVPTAKHWGLENEDGKETMAVCGGESCPICDLRHSMDKDEFKRISANTKYLVNCVVRSHIDNDDKDTLLVAELTYGTFQQLIEYIAPDGKNYKANALDPQKGYDFTIRGLKKGQKTEYEVKISEKPRPIGMKVEPEDLTLLAPKPNPDRLAALALLLDNQSEKD